MKHNPTHGGARKNAGRKTIEDKKKQINLYVNQSKIDLLGGEDGIKLFCYVMIEEMYNEKVKKGEGIKNIRPALVHITKLIRQQKKRKP